MSGDPQKAPRKLRLQALTVSVNYADCLECIAPNRHHFDRWLVVTEEADTRTQAVCRQWGMDVLISLRLHENGASFHKAAALNEGLAALDPDAWTIVLDSDILLPSDFRERLELQALDSDCLYGISGRRICRNVREFRHLAAHEPWGENLLFSTFVIGYFHLFHQAQRHNRYPESGSGDASAYDVLFSQGFPGHLHRYLPFTALHAGEPSVNWQGRTSQPFFPEDGSPWNEPPAPESAGAVAAETGGPAARAVILGCWRGDVPRALAPHFAEIITIDHWGLIAPALTPAAESDRAFLTGRYALETAAFPNIRPPQEHSAETIHSIPDGSLDLLWISPEPDYDFLLTILPAWVRKLRPGGAIAGGFYDAQAFPGTVSTVHLLLGIPDALHPGGRWVKRIAHPATFATARLTFPPPPETGRCIVYVCIRREEVEGLLVSLASLLDHWSGPVCVLCAGEDEPSLRMACARLGVSYLSIPPVAGGTPPILARLAVLEWAPGEEILLLGNETLVLQPLDSLFASLAGHPAAFVRVSPLQPAQVFLECFVWKKSAGVPAQLAVRGVAFINAIGFPVVDAMLSAYATGGAGEIPPAQAWSGPLRRTPETAAVVILHRLARGGAQRMLPAWEEMEQRLMARLAGGSV